MFGMNLIFLGDRSRVLEVVQALCSAHPEMLNPAVLSFGDQTTADAIAVAALLERHLVHELPPIRSTADLDRRLMFLRGINENRVPVCFFSVQDDLRSVPTQNPYIRHAMYQDKSLDWFRENSAQLWAEAKFAWEKPEEYAASRTIRAPSSNPAPGRSRSERRRGKR